MVKKWEILTNNITEDWIKKYFELEENEEVAVDWIGNSVGGVFEFADMFIGFNDILDCYKHNISKEKFHCWYEYCIENQFVNISLAKFILSPEEKAQKEAEDLKRLKENVAFAKKEFYKAMENYK
jgi:hypothetical protein